MNIKSNLLKSVALSSLLFSAVTANAQFSSLNPADFSVPSWTKLCRMANALQDGNQPYSINMTINGDPRSRMGFAWFTNKSVTNGVVQLVAKADAKESDFNTPQLVFNATSTDVDNLNYSIDRNNLEGITPNQKVSYRSHKALAVGLTPNTTYSYRVGSENGWSEIGHFTTAPSTSKAFSFIYITDTQAQNDEMFNVSQQTVHVARNLNPDAAFLLCNGDLVETSGSSNSEWEYEQWFETMQDVWLDCPLVVAQGNHDKSSNSNFAHHFNTDNSYNSSASVHTAMNGTVYSFVRGDVLFMVINYEDWNTPGYLTSLADWMRAQVNNNPNAKWRIATYHKNMFTGSKSHQDDQDGKAVREAMLPIFSELDIHIALQGHDHIYEVIGPVNNADKTLLEDKVEHVTLVSGGERENMTGKTGGTFHVGEGTLYFLNNSAGRKKYEPRNEDAMENSLSKHGVENYWSLFSGKFGQTGEPTFSRVDVDGDNIHIATYTVDSDGLPHLFDEFDVVNDDMSTSPTALSTNPADNVKITLANGVVNVSGINPDTIELFSLSGVKEAEIANSNSLVIINQPKGIYVVRAISGNDMYTTKITID
ncbi:MAG: fibronectin type III domain-containing protein [Bacteroidia bacterium]|nr:fibronectin type III domain-containing protein [Bacteroidia bacterium]